MVGLTASSRSMIAFSQAEWITVWMFRTVLPLSPLGWSFASGLSNRPSVRSRLYSFWIWRVVSLFSFVSPIYGLMWSRINVS